MNFLRLENVSFLTHNRELAAALNQQQFVRNDSGWSTAISNSHSNLPFYLGQNNFYS